jgi:hypothetical protein
MRSSQGVGSQISVHSGFSSDHPFDLSMSFYQTADYLQFSPTTTSIMRRPLLPLSVIVLLTLWLAPLKAQVTIRGTVYDWTMINGLAEVTISNTHGAIAISDTSGHYRIKVAQNDTIFFSYLQKQTVAFPVIDIRDTTSFNVSIDVVGPALMPVYVSHNNYYMDSILNRRENRENFDFQKGIGLRNLRTMPGGKGVMAGVSLDFDLFFNGDTRKSKELMQRWLLEQEQDKYIDHRFSRIVVRKITGLDSANLAIFMKTYRPTYEFLQSFTTDWEYYQFIKDCSKSFLADQAKDSAFLP